MALISESWIASLVGTNSLGSNLTASVAGALMYVALVVALSTAAGIIYGNLLA